MLGNLFAGQQDYDNTDTCDEPAQVYENDSDYE